MTFRVPYFKLYAYSMRKWPTASFLLDFPLAFHPTGLTYMGRLIAFIARSGTCDNSDTGKRLLSWPRGGRSLKFTHSDLYMNCPENLIKAQ